MLEEELYEPMRVWLEQYLKDHYKGHEIIAVDQRVVVEPDILRRVRISGRAQREKLHAPA